MQYKPPHEYRQKVEHKCAVCGKTFLAKKHVDHTTGKEGPRYCCEAHKQAAKYKRKTQQKQIVKEQ